MTTLRATRQRSAVLTALDTADDFLSAQELHGQLRAGGDSVGPVHRLSDRAGVGVVG